MGYMVGCAGEYNLAGRISQGFLPFWICPFLPKFGSQPSHEATKQLGPSGMRTSPSRNPPRLVPYCGSSIPTGIQAVPLGCYTPRQVDRQLIQLLSVGLSRLH